MEAKRCYWLQPLSLESNALVHLILYTDLSRKLLKIRKPIKRGKERS